MVFFFSSRRRHTRCLSDWSSDVCSSDLINWSSKPANLAALAEELELGLDSFILVDDNPRECREVEATYPQVPALTLPQRDEEIPEFLRHVWAFDRLRVTEEDRARPAMYA